MNSKKPRVKQKVCDSCGHKLSRTDKFCSNCGLKTLPNKTSKLSGNKLPDLMRKNGDGLYELNRFGLYEYAGSMDRNFRRKDAKTYEELVELGYKADNEPKRLPKYMVKEYTVKGKKYRDVFEITRYGSYIDLSIEDGMIQAHNAQSYRQLLKNGYKPSTEV